jgi:hypothetical protein
MKRFGRRALGCIILAAVMLAASGLASCSGNHAGDAGDGAGKAGDVSREAGADTAKVTLAVTAFLDGRDVTSDSTGMVGDANGNFAGVLETGADGLETRLAPGKYKVHVTYQGDYDGVPPMQVINVEMKAGQSTRKRVTLDKSVSMAAL